MLSLCRLCAKSMDEIEISCEISELQYKLSVCCGWKLSENESRMPQRACGVCVDELQRSWSFAERVQSAEHILNKLSSEIVSIEVEPPLNIGDLTTGMVKQELFVEPIEMENDFGCDDFDNSLNESDAESLQSNKNTDGEIMKAKSSLEQNVQSNENRLQCDDTIKPTKKYKQSEPFLSALLDEDHLPDGTISANGVAKLEKLFPDMKTMTWADVEFKCHTCILRFKSPQNFFAHNHSIHLNHIKSMDFFCVYCDSKHQLEYTLNQHIATKHFTHLKYRCYYCSDLFWQNSQLVKHRNEHIDVEYKCEQCGKVSLTRKVLLVHVAKKHLKKTYIDPNRKFICDICNRVFASKQNIQCHMLTMHMQKFDWICEICASKFHTKRSLTIHQNRMHASDMKK